jgi:RNA 2',3'-cyclic 3'-phosphodiesterase
MDDRIRAFLAADLAVATVRRIAEAQAAMRRAAEAGGFRVSWVDPSRMHVTLKFLGDIRAELVPAIGDRLARALEGRRAFEVEAAGVGAFPSPERPRVLWAGLRDGGAVGEVARATEGAMVDLGLPAEERAFHAHVTLGRVKEAPSPADFLADLREASFGKSFIHDVVLYQSTLNPKGPEYRALLRVPLGT